MGYPHKSHPRETPILSRYFGDADLQETLVGLGSDMTMIDVSSFIDADAARAAVVPPGSLTRHTGHSVYLFRKP